MDTSQDPHETGIVMEAAMSGNGAMIAVVVATMSSLLKEDRVGMVFLCRPDSKSIAWCRRGGVGMV